MGVSSQTVVENKPAVSKDRDFTAWLLDQAEALRGRRDAVDWEGIAEELEAMAAAERRELLNRLTTLCEHLLKLQFLSERLKRNARGWKVTITRTRTELRRILKDSPRLRGLLNDLSTEGYSDARRHVGREIGLARHQWENSFPAECPWSLEQLQDDDFYP